MSICSLKAFEVDLVSLRRLKVERIDLFQLHCFDPQVPFEEQVGVFVDLQQEEKIGQIGLANVPGDEIRQARTIAPPIPGIASVTHLEENLQGALVRLTDNTLRPYPGPPDQEGTR